MLRTARTLIVLLVVLGTAAGQQPKKPSGPANGGLGGAAAKPPAAPPNAVPGANAPPPPAPTSTYVPPKEIWGENLDQWIRKLNDKDPETRLSAIHVLPWFGPAAKTALPKLIALMSDKDLAVRSAALLICTTNPIDDPNQRQEILKKLVSNEFLAHSQIAIRIQAVMALARLGNVAKAAIVPLTEEFHLKNPNSSEARKAAAIALGQIAKEDSPGKGPDLRAIHALRSSLHDPALTVRLEVVQSLASLGPPVDLRERAAELQDIQHRLKVEPDQALMLWIQACLYRLDPKQQETQLNLIATALGSIDQRVRMNAAEAIGTLGPIAEKKISDLRIGFQCEKSEKQEDLEFLAMCLWAMGQMGGKASFLKPEVEKLKKHPNEYIQAYAQQTLNQIR